MTKNVALITLLLYTIYIFYLINNSLYLIFMKLTILQRIGYYLLFTEQKLTLESEFMISKFQGVLPNNK